MYARKRSILWEIKHRTYYTLLAQKPFPQEVRPGLPRLIANSFPKSGTHFLSKLIGNIGFTELPILLLPGGYCDFTKPGPWDKWAPIVENKVAKFGNPDFIQIPAINVLRRFREGQFAPTHFGKSDAIEKILKKKGFKHILIIRDLRDCVVSYVHHYLSLTGSFHRADWYYYLSALGNFEDQVIAVIQGRDLFLESYRRQIEDTSFWFDDPDVLVVCYEHLVGANGGGSDELQKNQIRSILDYLGMESGDEQVQKAAGSLWGGGSRTFRSGKTESWKDVFTPKIQEVFDQELGDIQAKVRRFIDQR